MPDGFLQIDTALPNLRGGESTERKLETVQNYLFLLLENLRYLLRNLSPENFNETEMTDWIGKTVKAETIISNTVITNELYSDYGAIADLTVDRLRTDYRRAQRYLNGDTSPIDYLRIHDEVIEFVTAATDGSETEQLVVDGKAFYWTDAGMTRMTSEKITAYPVTVYVYEEDVKGAFRFETVSQGGRTVKVPVLRLGAGDEQGRNWATIYKDTEGLQILYNDAAGRNIGMSCSKEGYTDLHGLRKPVRLNFSGWDGGSFHVLTEGGVNSGFGVTFDASDRPVRITDGAGHETAILWEPATGFINQPVPVTESDAAARAARLPLHGSVKLGTDTPGLYVFAVASDNRWYYLASETSCRPYLREVAPGGATYVAPDVTTRDAALGLYYGRETWPYTGGSYPSDVRVPEYASVAEGLTALRTYLDSL